MSTSRHDHVGIDDARIEDLGGGLFAYIQPDGSWFINNTGFLVGRDGVTLVDACSTERRTRAFRDAVTTVTDQPMRVLVNTHSHPDHTTGNALFAEAAIVAHEATRDDVKRGFPPLNGIWDPVDTGSLPPAPPFLTYRDGVTLWVDDLRCEVKHVGLPAHTTNDSIVWVPERSVLYAGDLVFAGGTPFLMSGSVAGSIQVLTDVIAPLNATTIVPGHGPVCGPEVITDVLEYLRFVQDTARAAKDAGLSPLDAGRETDLGRFAEWTDRERIVGNLHRAYAELDGAAPGAPLDITQVLTDMVTYNGGRPLTCYA
ncbi:MBL fold metallo-hydrolase [Cryptosporangium arvum]|uniref:MBL fold metallo-hydrolase n=1 Tax=Cryptosporangium arvum TaxID=80871 RepID=UPI0004B0FEEE|nr:MBL fold metallo-hydrolase [Cryptosporangium arvum]